MTVVESFLQFFPVILLFLLGVVDASGFIRFLD